MKEDKHTRNFIILMVVITLLSIIIAFTTKEEIFPDPTRESFKSNHAHSYKTALAINQLKTHNAEASIFYQDSSKKITSS